MAFKILKEINAVRQQKNADIAVIGMSCRFPGAVNVDEYWDNLVNGINCIRKFPENRNRDIEQMMKRMFAGYSGLGNLELAEGYLDEVDKFDAAFFRIAPSEALMMEPLQRMFLETVWEALEDAGYGGNRLYGTRTGVFVGRDHTTTESFYKFMFGQNDPLIYIGSFSGILASRTAYILNLRGPAQVTDTACSSGLVALHEACRAIRNKECDMAVVGGVQLVYFPLRGGLGMVESQDDRIRAFDRDASGTIWGEGLGSLLLKPLKNAVEDRDNIYTVIKGSAVNNDGATNGITAPSAEAQEELLLRLWEEAKINPETISYIEAHGTGTKLGDPIEIKGITNAFKKYTNKKQFCRIGSVKSNLGHLVGASGIASLIKVAYAMKEGVLPASIHFQDPNPFINFCESPVYVNNKLSKWEKGDTPRRAVVSAFGFSGTNCDILLEEAPETAREQENESGLPCMFTISAMTRRQLTELINRYIAFFDRNPGTNPGDACYTSNTGRGHYNCRMAVLASSTGELKEKLESALLSGLKNHEDKEIYFGEYKVAAALKKSRDEGELSEQEIHRASAEAETILSALTKESLNRCELLKELCLLYVKGAEIVWDKLYAGQERRKTRLPVYPFAPVRFWPQMAEPQESAGELYYNIQWIREEEESRIPDISDGDVLILMDRQGMGSRISAKYPRNGREVIEAVWGKEFSQTDETHFVFDGTEAGFETLLNRLGEKKLTRILHLQAMDLTGEINSIDELEHTQQCGAVCLFNLTRALMGKRPGARVDICIAAPYVHDITGCEKRLQPENATLFGLAKVISQEHPGIRIRCVDIDDQVTEADILKEIETVTDSQVSAYRNGKRYVQMLDRIRFTENNDEKLEIKSTGVYLITGGTGSIGLEVAKYLSARAKVNLALISRSEMPGGETWETILESRSDTKMCSRIEAIREMERNHAEVSCHSVDISKPEEVETLINELIRRYGRINGIIHSSGITGDGQPVVRKKNSLEEVLSPKVKGAWILDRATQQLQLDFMILFSSISTIVGGPGLADYTAANSYLDSFSAYRRKKGKRTLSINWTIWKDTGMAADHGMNFDGIFKAISTPVALKGFENVLFKDLPNITIGEVNFSSGIFLGGFPLPIKLSEWMKAEARKCTEKMKEESMAAAVNGNTPGSEAFDGKILGKAAEELTRTETAVARFWGSTLGLSEVDIYDNFYALGGDSILAAKLIRKINGEYPGCVNMSHIFYYPTVAGLAGYIDQSLGQKGNGHSRYPTMEKARERAYYPLSSAQKRMFILHDMNPSGTAYNIPVINSMDFNIDPGRLENAFRKLIQRHEALRTSFRMEGDEPVQVIHPEAAFELYCAEAPEAELGRLVKDFIRPFDLHSAPLLRAMLVKISAGRCCILFDMHHIITDGTSLVVMIRELNELYQGAALPEPVFQYRDYAVWQNSFSESPEVKRQCEYWLNKFSGGVPVLNLPADFPRPPVMSFEGNQYVFFIGKELLEKLKTLASKTNSTLYMVLFSAYNLLLSKYSGQEDIVTGTLITGRHLAGTEHIVGMFANTLAIRSNPRRDMTFRTFLEHTKGSILEAFDNQDLPYEELVEKLNLAGDMSRNPLFDTLFSLQSMFNTAEADQNLLSRSREAANNIARFSLSLTCIETAGMMEITLDYCTALFRPETVKRLAGHYINILEEVTGNPDAVLKQVRMLSEKEREGVGPSLKQMLNADFIFD